MNILINHCWCSESIWGGGGYSCRVIVSLNRVPEGKTYYDPPCPDWALVEEHPFDSKSLPDHSALFGRSTTLRLRLDVVRWLNQNVKDRTLRKWEKDRGEVEKGWAVGTDAYNSHTGVRFSIFFERQRDGMRFIKKWSVHKNPVSYLQYFKDIRKELDPTTGRLKRVPR